MKVSSRLRCAAHQALDLILDALAEDAPTKRRGPSLPKKVPMPDLPPERVAELREQLDMQMKRRGYVKRT